MTSPDEPSKPSWTWKNLLETDEEYARRRQTVDQRVEKIINAHRNPTPRLLKRLARERAWLIDQNFFLARQVAELCAELNKLAEENESLKRANADEEKAGERSRKRMKKEIDDLRNRNAVLEEHFSGGFLWDSERPDSRTTEEVSRAGASGVPNSSEA